MAPSPEGPRAFTITATNKGGLLVIASTTLMSWMVLCFMFRTYTRMNINGPFGVDDLTAGIGTLFGVIHVSVLLKAVTEGLGKSKSILDATQINVAEKFLYISDIFFLLGHYAAKVSVALLVRRLGRERLYRRICSGIKLRWQFAAAFDVLSEMLILSIVIYLVWGLRMSLTSKAVVVAAFGCRIPTIPATIVRVISIDGAVTPIDPTLRSVDSSICTEVLLHYSLMAATIPCLKPFVIAFNTGWGQGQGKGSSYVLRNSYGESTKRISRTVCGQNLTADHFSDEPCAHATEATGEFVDNRTEIRPGTIESDGSQRMIIQETRSWMVEHESYELRECTSAGKYGHSGTVYSAGS
ncbi:predicted protein [Uncinocarpus reesii 1704]|uniref:Rhodopsin domain-containing protein n=1 Tax=Uncinocarpus reesii (strain UAMH 1704) TaxID=336963 RepID=C4JY96_UNCRE|nr:uncharacterized protein UREG_07147 [Uncinocarpus reesii 1704]EEP82282.1 predicted protein [Uncinocarpus reesii 1704]